MWIYGYKSNITYHKDQKNKNFIYLSYFGDLSEEVANSFSKLNLNFTFKQLNKKSFSFNTKDLITNNKSGVYERDRWRVITNFINLVHRHRRLSLLKCEN